MSGIAGLLRPDGGPVNPGLLERMTASIGFRGPDACASWAGAGISLGHTLLRTTAESATETQPLTIDGRVWIIADARVDARTEMIQALVAAGEPGSLRTAPDVELILRAYLRWGEGCLSRLIGDFAFVVWDAERRRLFCARDQLGVKPFFYTQGPHVFAFSNTLNTLRLCPWVSTTYDEIAVTDFLLFGFCLDPARSIWRDIQRLPPGHKLIVEDGCTRIERYWTLEPSATIRYHKQEDYLAHFRGLLSQAVADRMRTERVAVLMSGGLDSTSIAATARHLAAEDGGGTEVRAYTAVHERLFADEEGLYAQRSADYIGIPIHILNVDDYPLYQDMERFAAAAPEPFDSPFPALADVMMGLVARDSRVLLDGQGGDEVLHEDCLIDLLLRWRSPALIRGLWSALFEQRRRPALCVRSRAKRLFRRDEREALAAFPSWVRGDVVERLDLRGRWIGAFAPLSRPPPGVLRRQAYERLGSPFWPQYLESGDPGVTGRPVESRWPFLDLRLVQDLLAFPPLPWFGDKRLLREVMRGRLPAEVLGRPKSPLGANPVALTIVRDLDRLAGSLTLDAAVKEYVRMSSVKEQLRRAADRIESDVDLRPLALGYWLRGHQSQSGWSI